MELYKIVLRVLFTYAFLLLLLRLSGKRAIAQGTPFDFVMALIVGDLIDDLVWAEAPAAKFVVAAGAILMAHVVFSALAFFSPRFVDWAEGKPKRVIAAGAPVGENLRSEWVSERELSSMLRQKGLAAHRRERVENGWLEDSGDLSVLESGTPLSEQQTPATGHKGAV